MRTIAAAILMAACMAPMAQAQSANLEGTWAFQSQSYGNEQIGAVMSGVAILTPSAPGRYDVRLISNELIVDRESGQSRLLTARQTCTAEDADGQISIECQMAEPLEGYTPDTFLLQSAGEPDHLAGVLNAGPEVGFSRLR
jgi:hypothetical protein